MFKFVYSLSYSKRKTSVYDEICIVRTFLCQSNMSQSCKFHNCMITVTQKITTWLKAYTTATLSAENEGIMSVLKLANSPMWHTEYLRMVRIQFMVQKVQGTNNKTHSTNSPVYKRSWDQYYKASASLLHSRTTVIINLFSLTFVAVIWLHYSL